MSPWADGHPCRRCGFTHRRRRWDMYDRAQPGVPCWTRDDVEIEYRSVTAGVLASAQVPNVGPWVRQQTLKANWNVMWAIKQCWPPECVTAKKVRSPRADVTMREWVAWAYQAANKKTNWSLGLVVDRAEALAWFQWALDQPRDVIETMLAMRALR